VSRHEKVEGMGLERKVYELISAWESEGRGFGGEESGSLRAFPELRVR